MTYHTINKIWNNVTMTTKLQNVQKKLNIMTHWVNNHEQDK
jgi:hypothetical protein